MNISYSMCCEHQYSDEYCSRKTKTCNLHSNTPSSQRKFAKLEVVCSDSCKLNDFLMHPFFSCFRCLEMLLQVQWQKNFLTSCSLLLKCHDWWWLKFDGEHRISPQVLHGAQVWALWDVYHEFQISQNTMSCHPQQLYRLRNWSLCSENVLCSVSLGWEREEEEDGVFLPGLRRKLSSTNLITHQREEWAKLHHLLVEGDKEHACGQHADSILPEVPVGGVFCPPDMLTF